MLAASPGDVKVLHDNVGHRVRPRVLVHGIPGMTDNRTQLCVEAVVHLLSIGVVVRGLASLGNTSPKLGPHNNQVESASKFLRLRGKTLRASPLYLILD